MEQNLIPPNPNVGIDRFAPAANRRHKKEFAASFIAGIGSISIGTVVGYTSTALPQMKTKFDFDDTAYSLIGSLMMVGSLVGALVSGAAVDFFGRKSLLMYNCVPFVVGWLILGLAQNVYMLFAGRLVTGFCVGITSTCVSVYIMEIASPEVRGTLLSCVQLFINFGMLLDFIVGSYIPWYYLAISAEIFPVLLILFMIPLPESPSWLIRKQRYLDAIDAIMWLRGTEEEANDECYKIQTEQLMESKMTWKQCSNPLILRPFFSILGIFIIQQACGITPVIFNTVDIIGSTSDTVNPQVAGIILGVFMLVTSFATFFLIDRAGRRVLLIISGFVMAVALTVLDTYYYLKVKDPLLVDHVWWLPVMCLIFFVVFFILGFGPIPWIMMVEVFPGQARGLASSALIAINMSVAFIVMQTFKSLQHAMGPFGTYWLYGGICLVGVFFVYFCVPETKDKTLREIQLYFVGDGLSQIVRQEMSINPASYIMV